MDFQTLIQKPESQRDAKWENAFLSQFPQLKVQLEGDQAKQGPDGWPYFFVRTQAEGAEPVPQLIQWLAARGMGLVVNAYKMMPDYVFTYGMLWHFVETGRFKEEDDGPRKAGDVIFGKDKKMIFGPPSEKYLPPYVRGVLREFLRAQGFATPTVLVASSSDYKEVDMILSIDSLGGLSKPEHRKFAEMMSWFLPLHYNLVLAQEDGLPAFHAL